MCAPVCIDSPILCRNVFVELFFYVAFEGIYQQFCCFDAGFVIFQSDIKNTTKAMMVKNTPDTLFAEYIPV